MNPVLKILLSALVSSLYYSCNSVSQPVSASLTSDSSVLKQIGKAVSNSEWLITGFSITDTSLLPTDNLFTYGIDASLPELTGSKPGAKVLNEAIRADFADIIRNGYPEAKTDIEHFRKISYRNFITDGVLSIVIEDLNAYHLSEATSEFRVYHYDISKAKILTTADVFEIWGMSQVPLLNAVAEQITSPPEHTEPLFKTEWFDAIKWKDINKLKFYKNNQGQYVIIYPLADNGIEAEQTLE